MLFLCHLLGWRMKKEKKTFLGDYKDYKVKEEDYEEIKSQAPKRKRADISQNTAYIEIKKYFLQVFQPVDIPVHPVINLTETDAKSEDPPKLPLDYAEYALKDILFQLIHKPIPPEPIPTFDEIQFKGELQISTEFSSFEKPKIKQK